MKLFKKAIALVLCVAMLFAVSIVAIAACNHPSTHWNPKFAGAYICTAYECGQSYVEREYCNSCGYLINEIVTVDDHGHNMKLTNATCNGYLQTWTYKCSYGGATAYGYTQKYNCPLAGHTGACGALPNTQL